MAVVAPFTGAWIETWSPFLSVPAQLSHPLRVRGLKQRMRITAGYGDPVAPFTGAWIETGFSIRPPVRDRRRTLYGCVD